jgi:hypothetical protein
MSIEVTNEPMPAPRASGRTWGRLYLKFVREATGELLGEVESDPMHENERRTRDDAKILDVGHRSE